MNQVVTGHWALWTVFGAVVLGMLAHTAWKIGTMPALLVMAGVLAVAITASLLRGRPAAPGASPYNQPLAEEHSSPPARLNRSTTEV